MPACASYALPVTRISVGVVPAAVLVVAPAACPPYREFRAVSPDFGTIRQLQDTTIQRACLRKSPLPLSRPLRVLRVVEVKKRASRKSDQIGD